MKKDIKETEEPPGNRLKDLRTVYICNLSEDVWSFIRTFGDKEAKRLEIEENANLADRDVFSVIDEYQPIFLTPKNIDKDFLEYCCNLFRVKDLTVLVPRKHSGEVCKDAIADDRILKNLVKLSGKRKELIIKSYSASEQFWNLVGRLRRRKIKVYTPESPLEDAAWSVNFFGSKSGIRQLSQQSEVVEPDFKMAGGVICAGVFDAAKIAAHKYISEKGVVIKTNKGHAGAGILIFRKGDLPGRYKECEKHIRRILKKDKYWERFPIVIESLIKINYRLGGGFPNVEFKVVKNGKIELLYYGGMRISRSGVFKGMEIGKGVINHRVATRMIDTGYYIAEAYGKVGYRGYFDIDFSAAKNGEIYVTESNVRRTGGTHVYKAALRLWGKDFMDKGFILSNNSYDLPWRKITFSKLVGLLAPVMYQKKKGEGVVVASANMLSQGKLAYIVFGKTENRALNIERRMEDLLDGK